MPLSIVEAELQLLIKLEKRQVELMKNGVRVQSVCMQTIDALIIEGTTARFRLARKFLVTAKKLRKLRPPAHRSSTSRSYYSMYHAARSVSFIAHSGDNFQEHKDIYKGLPDDFPDVDVWRNNLKDARVRRNEADYDPYPVSESDFKRLSKQLLNWATDFCDEAEVYLRNKGCAL